MTRSTPEATHAAADVAAHYSSGELLARLDAALRDDGVDPEHPSIDALAPYDHFHGRGIEATQEIAGRVNIAASHRLLDVGSGFGGPARYFADRFGCHVTGVDLTDEFCAVARILTRRLGLEERVTIEQGDALALPFPDATFDGAYSMNVSMNIEDKAAFYREIHRVLRPGGWLALSEASAGQHADSIEYPTPWAKTAASSFLTTSDATRTGLEAAGFRVLTLEEKRDAALAYGARSRELVASGHKPPHRAVQVVHGEHAPIIMTNSARSMKAGKVLPIEVHCVKR